MGIIDLLMMTSNLFINKHISDYKGKRVGIDSYVWLHRSVYGDNLSMAFGENEDAYLIYLRKCVDLLLKNGVTPIFVFDGDKLPLKQKTENSRNVAREAKQNKAQQLLDNGEEIKAKLAYIRSIDITPEMAYKFIQMLSTMNIEYYTAPYEADAQLAYMAKNKLVDVVCTEDSDLIAYNCPEIIYKLDLKTGKCKHLTSRKLFENETSKFYGWSYEMFLDFCILSGCDYFRVVGISSKTSYKLIKKFGSFSKIESPKLAKNRNVTNELFEKAKDAFTKHIVYCPILKRQISMEPENVYVPDYLGKIETDSLIIDLLVKSYINPINYMLFLK